MKRLLLKIIARLRREAYLPTQLGILLSPVYIIREGLAKELTRIAPRITGRVLDFGCGSKPYQSLFTNATSYIGVDIESSGHDHSTSKIDYFYDGRRLPFEDSCFDAVVSFEVCEHIFNIDEIIGEMVRVLRPGGKVLISIPFAWNEHEDPYDFARYTSFGIRYLLESKGIEILELRKTSTFFLAVGQLFIEYVSRFMSPRLKFLARLFQLLVIFPMNLTVLLLNYLFPKDYSFFCNCVVLGCNNKRADSAHSMR